MMMKNKLTEIGERLFPFFVSYYSFLPLPATLNCSYPYPPHFCMPAAIDISRATMRLPPPPPPPLHRDDASEVDTVLDTPTSIIGHNSGRWSLTGSWSSRHKKRASEVIYPTIHSPPFHPSRASLPPPIREHDWLGMSSIWMTNTTNKVNDSDNALEHRSSKTHGLRDTKKTQLARRRQRQRRWQSIHSSNSRAATKLRSQMKTMKEEKDEMEQTLDVVHKEMEKIMLELDEIKQERDQSRAQLTRLQGIMAEIGKKHGNEAAVLVQKETLHRVSELEAECRKLKRDKDYARLQANEAEEKLAETELKLEVAKSMSKKQVQQLEATIAKLELQAKDHTECRQVESALQRAVSERDADMSKMQRALEQAELLLSQKHAAWEEERKRDRSAWEQHLHDEFSARYIHERNVFQVQTSRELRELAGRIAELEVDAERLQDQHDKDLIYLQKAEDAQKKAKTQLEQSKREWKISEQNFQKTIASLEDKIAKLEQDALQLYSKNIKLASQLGEWAP